MKEIKRKTIVIGASVMPKHIKLIEHLMEDKDTFTSASDVIRRAVEFFHDKTYPAYVFALTPAGQERKSKQDKKIKEDLVSDADFAKNLKCVVMTNKSGIEYALMHQLGNMVMAIPVVGFKEWWKNHEAEANLHLSKVKSTAVESMLTSPYMKGLLERGYELDMSAYK